MPSFTTMQTRMRWPCAGRAVLGRTTVLWLTLWLTACAGGGGAYPRQEMELGTAGAPAGEQTEFRRRAQIRLELAANYFDAGQDKIALEEVQQAIALDSQLADAHNLRALIQMRLGQLPEAEASFRRAQGLRPGDPDIAHNHGWLLCQDRRYAQAQALFAEALAKPAYRTKAKTWMAQGVCWAEEGHFAEAERALLKAHEFDPANPVVAYQLASVLYRAKAYQRAQFYIRRVNNGEYSNAESLFLGVKIENALGNSRAVQQLASQLKKRYPDSREWMDVERNKIHD